MNTAKALLAFYLKLSIVLCHRSRKPNIIIFIVDDLGWNDVGFHGETEVPTPNIDALAYNGIILNNYYTYPACSPSRSALMTGRYATSTGLQHYVILDVQPVGLPLATKTLPQYLNRLGYHSHMVGKWHLGFSSVKYTPLQRGFKSHYGFWNGDSDFFFHTTELQMNRTALSNVPCYENEDRILLQGLNFRNGYGKVNKPGQYLTDLYTRRAVKIINNHNREEPLFLYLAHHGVHRGNFLRPIRSPESLRKLFTNLKDNSPRQNFAASMTAIDRSLGHVMEALANKGMLRNTLIVFSTDNGAPIPGSAPYNGGSNFPLRGGKVSAWEGGIRGSAFVWSGKLRNAGFVYNGLMHITDWLPTLLTAAGSSSMLKHLHGLDAIDMWDAIRKNRSSPRGNILLQADPLFNLTAYRSGDYKIVSGQPPAPPDPNGYYGSPGRLPPPPQVPTTGSKTEKVLKKVFGSNVKLTGTPIRVKCGDENQKEECNPLQEVCLFHLKDDPCEYNNLAKTQRQILSRLQNELRQKYFAPPNSPQGNYKSNPVFHDGFWSPWTDKEFNIDGGSC